MPSKSLIAPLFAVQECEELWQAGRQQCEAVSLTGKPCVLPHHAAAPAGAQPSGGQLQQEASNHTSGHQWLLATVDGQAQLQVPDAFRVSAANELLRPGGRRVQEGSQAPQQQQQQGKRKQQQMPPRPLDMRVLLTLPVELAAHLLQGLTLGSTSSLEGTADVLRWKGGRWAAARPCSRLNRVAAQLLHSMGVMFYMRQEPLGAPRALCVLLSRLLYTALELSGILFQLH